MTHPRQMTAAYLPDLPSFCATSGISNEPGTRTRSMRSSRDAVPLERVGRARDELIDDELVEPGRDQREPAGGGGEVAFVEHVSMARDVCERSNRRDVHSHSH